jgi:hypothetical protein
VNPVKVLVGYVVFLGVLLLPFVPKWNTIWWDESVFLSAIIISSVLYGLILWVIRSGFIGRSLKQYKSTVKSVAFHFQGNQLRHAKKLLDDGLLTQAEYEARVQEIKAK